jgi:ABC-type glycerol-3-phosphate transport system substrate-binding protein
VLTYRSQTTRRRYVAGVMATAGATTAAACAGQGDQLAPGAGGVSLRGAVVDYWNSQAPTSPAETARKAILEDFNQRNPDGITVDLAAAAGQGVANLEKLLGALAAGTPPDLVSGFSHQVSLLHTRGGLVAIDTELRGNAEWRRVRPSIYANTLRGHTWKGTLFDIPTHNSIFLMYYHRGLLRRAGLAAPPAPRDWTWDRFLEFARKASQPPEISGYDDNWSWSRTGMMMLNNGARFVNQDGTKFQYTGVEIQETVEWQLQLSRSGVMRAHDGTASGGYAEKLPDGKVVFQFAVANRVPTYRQQGIEFGTCTFPIGPKNTARTSFSHGDSQGLAVFKKPAQKVQAALQVALWATRPESLNAFAENGLTAAYRHVVESPEFKARWQRDAEQWPFYEVQPNFIPYPNFPGFTDALALADQQLRDIWAGKTSVRDGLAEVQRQAQRLLDEALRT